MDGVMLLFLLPLIFISVDFVVYLSINKSFLPSFTRKAFEILYLFILPFLYLVFMDGPTNDCCDNTAIFSPEHRLTIHTIIILSIVSYFYLRAKSISGGPLLVVVANCFLLLGIAFNFVMYFQENEMWFWGNLPVIILFIHQLTRNHRQFIANNKYTVPANAWQQWAYIVVRTNVFIKYPLLFVLCFPIVIILIGLLLLFGQETDSIVRAFTDTYKHGLSQLNSECDSVVCDGHYLCIVAARGHKSVVKPVRLGERAGSTIVCNRQLLIANAFEDLLVQYSPRLHKKIRRNYNKVGSMVHRYYGVFKYKLVADTVYVLMKPLEWFFLLVLYIADSKPENRIAMQYIKPANKQKLEKNLNL